VYCEFYNAKLGHNGSDEYLAYATMIRTDRYKLVVAHDLGTGELYGLQQDPDELGNLWDDARVRNVKTELLLRMTHRMAYTCDPLPERIAPW
jgi:hypothetical protein